MVDNTLVFRSYCHKKLENNNSTRILLRKNIPQASSPVAEDKGHTV